MTKYQTFYFNIKINKLKINIPGSAQDLQNDLKLALIRGDMEIIQMPEK